jgi:hypothetical protein
LTHHVEEGLWFSAAEIGQSPGRIPEHRELGRFFELLEKRRKRVVLQYEVTALRGISSNVSQRPHGLLSHVVIGRVEQLHEDGHCALIDDHASLFGRPRRDVGQCPSSFELVRVGGEVRGG